MTILAIADKYPATEEMAKSRRESGLWHKCYDKKLECLAEQLELLDDSSVIVELGSGLTTTMLDESAFHHSHHVTTIDMPKWSEKTRDWLPRNAVKFVECQVAYPKGVKYCYYDTNDYPPEIDLLYVDGPNLRSRIGVDAVWIATEFIVRRVLFDVRRTSANYFMHKHSGEYKKMPARHHTRFDLVG